MNTSNAPSNLTLCIYKKKTEDIISQSYKKKIKTCKQHYIEEHALNSQNIIRCWNMSSTSVFVLLNFNCLAMRPVWFIFMKHFTFLLIDEIYE